MINAILLKNRNANNVFCQLLVNVVYCGLNPFTHKVTSSIAKLYGLVAPTVQIAYQKDEEGGSMSPLKSIHELPAALATQPGLSALPIEVSGEEQLHLPLFHFLSCLVSLIQFGVLCAFAYYEVYLPQLEAPWFYVVAFPAAVRLANVWIRSSRGGRGG